MFLGLFGGCFSPHPAISPRMMKACLFHSTLMFNRVLVFRKLKAPFCTTFWRDGDVIYDDYTIYDDGCRSQYVVLNCASMYTVFSLFRILISVLVLVQLLIYGTSVTATSIASPLISSSHSPKIQVESLVPCLRTCHLLASRASSNGS